MARKSYRRRAPRYRRKTTSSKRRWSRRRTYNTDRGAPLNAMFKQANAMSTSATGTVRHEYTDTYVASAPFNDWTFFSGLYDQFRVRAVKLQYYPRFSNQSLTEVITTPLHQFHPLYVIFDIDNTTMSGILTTNNEALEYAGVKVKQVNRPWTYYHKYGKKSQTGTGNISTGGWQDIASYAPTQVVSILQNNANLLPASVELGDVLATYYVQFRYRR